MSPFRKRERLYSPAFAHRATQSPLTPCSAMHSTRTFEPWIGSKYVAEGLDGLRLLIVGESHYGSGTESADFTRSIVQKWGREKRHRYFTTVAKLVLDRGSAYISDAERADFWDRVAFTNYVQSFVDESAESRARPTEEMWEAAREPFRQTVRKADPDAILVTGLELGRRLPNVDVLCHSIQHPSQYLKYAKWQPGVQSFFSSARARVP